MSKFWSPFPFERINATNVDFLYRHFFKTLYNNVSRVILLKGTEDHPKIDYDFAMINLILSGKIIIIKHKNEIYFLDGHSGGKYNATYRPTEIISANPVIGDIRRELDKDGVVVYLTPFDNIPLNNPIRTGGIYTNIAMTAALLADNISSINNAQINGRLQAIYTSEDSGEAIAAEAVLKDLYSGKPFRVIKSEMLKKFEAFPLSNTNTAQVLMELVEVHQYLLAQFWNSIGIDANFNMKRERLNTAEVEANSTSIKVPVNTMLDMINKGFDKANEIFGTNFHAELNPEFKPEKPIVTKLSDEKESEESVEDNSTTDDDAGT